MSTPKFAGDQLPHPRQSFGRSGVRSEEFLSQPHGAERQADRVLDALMLGERDFATATAEADQQHTAADAGLAAHEAAVDKAAFLEAGNDLHVPAGLSLNPGLKGGPIAGVAHRRRGHHANLVCAMCLDCALKAFESAQGCSHGFRGYKSRFKDAGAKPRHFAIFVKRLQTVGDHLGDLEPAGIGTDIYCGKGRHGRQARSESWNLSLGSRYTTAGGEKRLEE